MITLPAKDQRRAWVVEQIDARTASQGWTQFPGHHHDLHPKVDISHLILTVRVDLRGSS